LSWAPIFKKHALIGITVFFLGCSAKLVRQNLEPERADREIWKSLTRVSSFSFSLYYHTDWPTTISARYSGIYNSPDREKWDGYWERENEKRMVQLRAKGDVQFAMEDGRWEKMPRGVETKIFDQIEQVLQNTELEYLGLEKGRFRYQFKPNLPLLDLPGLKHIIGILEIDAKSGLPLRIYCCADDRSAEWDMRFERFNQAGRIKFPFVPAARVLLDASGTVNFFKIKKAKAIIQNRLKFLGVECRFNSSGLLSCSKFEVKLNEVFTHPTLRLLFGTGRVEIWDAVWSDSLYSSGKSLPVAGDAAKQVVLKTLLAGNQELNAEPIFDPPIVPKLRTVVRAGQDRSRGLTVLVLDGVVLGIGVWEDAERCVFSDIGSPETVRTIAALASQQPLPLEFQVTVRDN